MILDVSEQEATVSLFADAPRCVSEGVVVLRTKLRERLVLTCEVDSSPPPLSYSWSFSDYAGDRGEPVKVDSPTFSFAPSSPKDFGFISCSAKNAIQEQKRPCVFRVDPVAVTNHVENCSLSRSQDSLSVDCGEADGDHGQTYVLQLVDMSTGESLNRIESKVGDHQYLNPCDSYNHSLPESTL